jgi:hypothetical protein
MTSPYSSADGSTDPTVTDTHSISPLTKEIQNDHDDD